MSLAQQISRRWGISERHQRRFTQLLQLLLLGVACYGLVTIQLRVVLTSGIPLLVSLLPMYLRRNHGIPLDAGWMLWVTAAVAIHVFGTLVFYDRVEWYDQIAHALSGALVAACGFALVRAVDFASDDIELTEEFLSVFTVITVLAVGVGRELAESGTEIVAKYVGGDAALVVRLKIQPGQMSWMPVTRLEGVKTSYNRGR